MSKSVVSIVKGTDPDTMVEQALAQLGGLEALFKPGATFVLKPNAGHAYTADTSVNTNPAVVAAVVKALKKTNPKEIIIAEASATGCDSLECLEMSGIASAALEAGADRIIDIKREKDLVDIPIPDARSALKLVRLPRFLLEADYLINLPIFKSHVSMVFSCALKNIKGVVQDKVHVQMHQTDLAAAMMDMWSVIKVDLTIADLIRPMEGFGPHSGSPIDFGCIVAGKDPVAIDATVCRMVGLPVDKVDYFPPALERGIGKVAEEDIEVRGPSVKEVFKQLWLPYMEGFGGWPEYNVYAEGACSSCQSLAAFTLVKLQGLGEYEKNAGVNFVVGRKKELPEGVEPDENLVLMGDCLKGLWKRIEKEGGKCCYVDGCPPIEPGPLWAIIDRRTHLIADEMADTEGLRNRLESENEIYMKWFRQRERGMRE